MSIHSITDGRFVCTADPTAPCRNYAACECEAWSPELHGESPAPGHEPVLQDECWIKPWLDATELTDTYVSPTGEYGYCVDDDEWPDGPIDYEWDGDSVLWHYADGTVPTFAEDES